MDSSSHSMRRSAWMRSRARKRSTFSASEWPKFALIAKCFRVRSRAAKREKERDRVHVALRSRPHKAEARLLIESLGVEDLQHADVAFVVALARQVDIVAGRILRVGLRFELLGAMVERLQGIGDLSESHQHRL